MSHTSITIRVGLELAYEASAPTPMSLLIQPRPDPWQHLQREELSFSPDISYRESEDVHGNIVRIFDLPAGRTTIRHDAMVSVPALPEDYGAVDGAVPDGGAPGGQVEDADNVAMHVLGFADENVGRKAELLALEMLPRVEPRLDEQAYRRGRGGFVGKLEPDANGDVG